MKKLKLKTLVIFSVLITLTVCLKAQESGNKICLSTSEIDYFINQDLNAKSLAIDTSLMGKKIKTSDSLFNISEKNNIDLKKNESDLKEQVKSTKVIINNYKLDLNNSNLRNESKSKWNKIFKKIIVICVSVIILESSFIYLITK